MKHVEIIADIQCDPQRSLLIFDHTLPHLSLEIKNWVETFEIRYPVQAGEELKDAELFLTHVKKIHKLAKPIGRAQLQIVALGGGSVGDFAGFVASILWRGVDLIHIPSTYLAAIDSAHGGKTGINLDGEKNQLGTFYPAKEIWIVNEILKIQKNAQKLGGMGELLKAAILTPKPWGRKLFQEPVPSEKILDYLEEAVHFKMDVVKSDPQEKTGARQQLNLGHTLGHALESRNRDLNHGAAIGKGLIFAILWSRKRGYLSKDVAEEMLSVLRPLFDAEGSPSATLKVEDLLKSLRADKKGTGHGSVWFIFVDGWGKYHREKIAFQDLADEAQEQGWLS